MAMENPEMMGKVNEPVVVENFHQVMGF